MRGFDLVGYEDSVYLSDFVHDYDHKKNYFFHAGETRNLENQNIVDAIAIDSKRIGHGLTSCDN